MSTSNRLKNKQKTKPNSTTQQQNTTSSTSPQTNIKNHEQRQQQYEQYVPLRQCNPLGVTPFCDLFPANYDVFQEFQVTLGFQAGPMLVLENQGVVTLNQPLNMMPQCANCRSYMNCYNQIIQNNKYQCFLCQLQNPIPKNDNHEQSTAQREHSIYQTQSITNFYSQDPDPQTFVFLIDISPQSYRCKALYYCIAAIKQTLARTDLDETCIYFFTYDESVQEYEFEGEEVRCIIYDKSIEEKKVDCQVKGFPLVQIRDKLFQLLDTLEQVSANNKRDVSNFTKCFDYVYKSLKHTDAKFFIFQCSEAITGEQMFWQVPPQTIIKGQPKQIIQPSWAKPQSLFQTANKTFMNKYSNFLTNNQCNFSLFIFATNFKNVRIFSDFMKLSSSEIKVYSKNNAVDFNRFYYQFSYLLGATYFRKVHVQLIPGRDWFFTGVYGNFRKLNQRISFNFPYFQPSRKMLITMAPSKYANWAMPYCAFQMITHYKYKSQSFATVATIVQPVSSKLQKLYQSINPQQLCSIYIKMFLSALRMQNVENSRKSIIQLTRNCYTSALKFFKKAQNIPDSIFLLISSILASLKTPLCQPDKCHSTPLFDRIVAERNFLQSCPSSQIFTMHNPYLFDLSNLTEQMCSQQGQFVYPPTVEVKFQNTRQGLFLMDAGLCMYLFIAKICDPELQTQLFGHPSKQSNMAEPLTQQLIDSQDTWISNKVQRLVKYLRWQKSYGWIPLYIVKCGEGTNIEREFYMKYYMEKFDEFKFYKYNLEEFIQIIQQF